MNLDKKQSAFPQEYYGDDPRWFIATVIDARPLPETKLIGRVQIRIHGVHSPFLSDIPQADLPWAQVVMPPTTGGTSGLGSTLRIEAGSLVFGIFLDGKHSQEPLVMGTIPHYEYQSPVQGGTQSGFEQPKINKEAAKDGDTSADITSETRENRQNEAVKHFMANAYSQAQAEAMTAGMDFVSGMVTGFHPDPRNEEGEETFGLMGLEGAELQELKNFTDDYESFEGQLEFVSHKLNTSSRDAKTAIFTCDQTVSKNSENNLPKVTAEKLLNITRDDQKNQIVENANLLDDKLGGGG